MLFPRIEAGNCSTIPSATIERANTAFKIDGPRITIHPKVRGAVRDDVYLVWDLSMMVERAKLTHNLDGTSLGPNFTYAVPLPPGNPLSVDGYDPLQDYVSNVACYGQSTYPCSPILQVLYMSDFDCWLNHIVAPFHGFTRETIFVHYTHPTHANFSFTAEHHVLDGDLVVTFNNTGVPAHETYSKDSLKLNYIWDTFPWAGAEPVRFFTNSAGEVNNNGSAMDFWVDYSMSIPFKSNFTYATDKSTRNLTIVGIDEPVTTFLHVSTIHVADNFGFVEVGPRTLSHISDLESLNITAKTRSLVAEGRVGHWKHLEYDPLLGSLFTGDPDAPSASPNKAKSKPIWPWIVGAFAIVIVLVIAIALVITFIPAAKVLLRPFVQRRDPTKYNSSSRASEGQGGWTKGNRPTSN